MEMNWDDAKARADLAVRVGVAEYNRRRKLHRDSLQKTVGGHEIRPEPSMFNEDVTIYRVGATGMAFASLAVAEEYAAKHPVPTPQPKLL